MHRYKREELKHSIPIIFDLKIKLKNPAGLLEIFFSEFTIFLEYFLHLKCKPTTLLLKMDLCKKSQECTKYFQQMAKLNTAQ